MSRILVRKVVVDDIEPMENADTLEVARVTGWRCVVKKGDFKKGDIALYFECDAALSAHDNRFEFLKERCYKKFNLHGKLFDECIRIRTMKLRGVLSQGLLMHPEMFCEVRNKQLGEDCSDVLAVRHYDEVAEKFVRETAPMKPADQKGPFPSCCPKTDEERIQNVDDETLRRILLDDKLFEITEKMDGCVAGTTPIMTNQGDVRINKIVTNKLPVEVLTYNEETKQCEYKPISGYHKYKATKPMVSIYIARKADSAKTARTTSIECTIDHLFMTDKGWTQAGNLRKGDVIYRYVSQVPAVCTDMLLGCLLGDSSFAYRHCGDDQHTFANSIAFGHSEPQEDYLQCKARLLGKLWIDSGWYTSGYGSKVHRGHTVSDPYVNWLINTYCLVDGRKHITEGWLARISPISLAFWHMDDGCLFNSDVQRAHIELQTQRWSDEEVSMLCNMLKTRFGFSPTLRECSKTHRNIIRISADDTEVFCALIAPFVPQSMKYKLTPAYRNVPYILDSYPRVESNGLIPSYVMDVEQYAPDNKHQTVYDLTVEGNHNYFAHGVLIHNSSMTVGWSKSYRLDDPLFVCSRNFELKDMPSAYWDMVHKLELGKKLEQYWLDYGHEIAIQGELTGPGIQNNPDKQQERSFHVFRIWDIETQRWLDPTDRYAVCQMLGLDHVPVLKSTGLLDFMPMPQHEPDKWCAEALQELRDNILKYADGKTANGNLREGVVFKAYDGSFSFKAVSNNYLLSQK